MIRGLAAVALALGLAASALAGGAAQVAAHRGGALLRPENSLLAFRHAIALGADWLETDVHLTADDEVVVLHDPTLNRTTTGRGPVRGASLAALGPLRLRARDGSPTEEPIPTLARVLDLLGGTRAGLLLEIKADAAGGRYPGIEDRVLELVRARGLIDRTLFMAFQPDTVRRVRQLEPAARTVLLIGRGRNERERAAVADAVRLARAAGAAWLGLDHRVLDADLVAAARAAGLSVAAWTVNQEADVRRVLGLGVDVVISDRPDQVLRLVGRPPRTP